MNNFDWPAAFVAAITGVVTGGLVLVFSGILATYMHNEGVLLFGLWISGFVCGFINRLAYVYLRRPL